MAHPSSAAVCYPYRIAVEWGAMTVMTPMIQKDVQVLPAQPGRRNSVAFWPTGMVAALGAKDAASKATTYLGFEVPVALPDALPSDYNGVALNTIFIGYNHLLRGTLSKPKDARVVITIDAAGTTKVFEFPFGVATGETPDSPMPPDFVLPFFSPMNVSALGNPQQYPAVAPYAVTVVASVERRTPQAEVYVMLDAMDVEAAYSAPADPVPPACG
jgi:hypothetical protein